MPHILIVDDEITMLKGIEFNLQEQPGFQIYSSSNLEQAIQILETEELDLVISDLMLPKIEDGLEVMRIAKQQNYNPAVLAMTAFDTAENAVKAMKAGADDFISKGFNPDELVLRINNLLEKKNYLDQIAFENSILRDTIKKQYNDFKIIGKSKSIRSLIRKIRRVADDANSNCLIYGESGTGKELIARSIHLMSRRCKSPFVPINCAAIPENLIESELFGHEKGAFTGAISTQQGKFEQASEGIFFLDEIGELPLQMQVRLLRVLEERCFYRIGGKRLINVDVMVLAATNIDLYDQVKKGKFREDLYYRLNVIKLYAPPLRERTEDIVELTHFFLEKLNKERKKNMTISQEALQVLSDYPFRGNVRELRNILEDALVFCTDNVIEPRNLSLLHQQNEKDWEIENQKSFTKIQSYLNLPYFKAVEEFEKIYFERLLLQNLGNFTKAAEKAEMSREWLSKKVRNAGLKKSKKNLS